MLNGLAGKVAIVTGGAGGLGSASARRLSEEGCRVVVVDIDGDGARKVAESPPGENAWAAADVSREDDVMGYLGEATRTFGPIDFHHLNAGIPGSAGGFPDHPSLRGSADLIAYQTSKHAVLGLLRGAAMYGGPLGIRVNAVAPGVVPTELFSAAGRDDMVRRAATAPLRRAGTGAEIASVVAFLLSAGAAYLTGEVVSVDCGSSIVSTVRPSGGAGDLDFGPLDERTYGQRE